MQELNHTLYINFKCNFLCVYLAQTIFLILLTFDNTMQSNEIMPVIHIGMSELVVTRNQNSIITTFVGSCVAVCLYDVQQKIAGMAHVMLPKNPKYSTNKNLGKYADEAIPHILQKMQRNGSEIKNIKAKISGGAKIFAHENDDTA